jgi:hypothetical protein
MPNDLSMANRPRPEATVFDVAESSSGYPWRQCLKDAEVGEALALVSYDSGLSKIRHCQ